MSPCTRILLALAIISILQTLIGQVAAGGSTSAPAAPSRPPSTPAVTSTASSSTISRTASASQSRSVPSVPTSTNSKVPATPVSTSKPASPTRPSPIYTSPAGRTYTGLSNSPVFSRGPNSVYQPAASYQRLPYSGPVQMAASGVYVPKTALTSQYPLSGVRYTIPAAYAAGVAVTHTSGTAVVVVSNRPYVHTYPPGYTIIFIPYYSPTYRRSYGHWAVYNEQNVFYDFDDGDATEDFYDYDGADGLPAGCEYSASGEDFLAGPPLDLSAAATAPATGPPALEPPAPAPWVTEYYSSAPAPSAAVPGAQAPGSGGVTQRFVSLQSIAGAGGAQGRASVDPAPSRDVPQLALLPELAPLGELAPTPELTPLPELPALPDLAPLPDLALLPEMAALPEFIVMNSAPDASAWADILAADPVLAGLPQAPDATGPNIALQAAPAPAPGISVAGPTKSITCKPIPTRAQQT